MSAARFADLARRAELSVDWGSLEGWTALAAVTGDRFDLAEAYFGGWMEFYPGLDRRGGAAFLIGGIAYAMTSAMAALHFSEGVTPDLAAVGIALEGRELRYRLPEDMVVEASDPLLIAERLEAAIMPLVARLKAETRLAPAAQWRCVADSFASAFLYTGRALGCEARARLEAVSALAQPGLKMANRQTGYREVSIECSDGCEVSQHFLKRGGCCRYYTADNAEYCTTCVLRPEEQQVERLEAYLHRVHEPAIAAE